MGAIKLVSCLLDLIALILQPHPEPKHSTGTSIAYLLNFLVPLCNGDVLPHSTRQIRGKNNYNAVCVL